MLAPPLNSAFSTSLAGGGGKPTHIKIFTNHWFTTDN